MGDERHPEPALERQDLSPSRQARVTLPPGTVVAGKDHQGVLVDAHLPQGIQDLAHAPVQLFNSIAIETCLGPPCKVLRCVCRMVGHGVGQVQEKGLVAVVADECLRFPGEILG